ncbi:DUF2783 domain-containing protein [Algicella marina]|uniref:DUF2783 domain-containing protein n=1 Tax=Algicella marina TaxID=2683284 RepID=A0A6P1T184_9RHOB|nr:DUF2783 domain-containing protein [Algicella marina]QHQ35515.1 DUF2783 domain-containing protein [Algicella marina]
MREIMADGLGAAGDDFYEGLMRAHESRSEEQSHALNARLVLLMANEIGDAGRLSALLETAASYGN